MTTRRRRRRQSRAEPSRAEVTQRVSTEGIELQEERTQEGDKVSIVLKSEHSTVTGAGPVESGPGSWV